MVTEDKIISWIREIYTRHPYNQNFSMIDACLQNLNDKYGEELASKYFTYFIKYYFVYLGYEDVFLYDELPYHKRINLGYLTPSYQKYILICTKDSKKYCIICIWKNMPYSYYVTPLWIRTLIYKKSVDHFAVFTNNQFCIKRGDLIYFDRSRLGGLYFNKFMRHILQKDSLLKICTRFIHRNMEHYKDNVKYLNRDIKKKLLELKIN